MHAVLATDSKMRCVKALTRNSPPALLRGLVYAPTGSRMVPSYTVKTKSGGKRYRYYADLKYVRYGTSAETYGSINADQLEDARQILRDIESLDGHTSFLFNKINFLMDATVGFININQNQRVSKLTTISVIFMPINIVAGIGGMSEFSMMTSGVPWPLAYGGFTLVMSAIGWVTYRALRHFEQRGSAARMEKAAGASQSA